MRTRADKSAGGTIKRPPQSVREAEKNVMSNENQERPASYLWAKGAKPAKHLLNRPHAPGHSRHGCCCACAGFHSVSQSYYNRSTGAERHHHLRALHERCLHVHHGPRTHLRLLRKALLRKAILGEAQHRHTCALLHLEHRLHLGEHFTALASSVCQTGTV